MELEKLKKIVEDKFEINLKNTNRKRELVYAKKVYCKIAYDLDIKNTFEKIGEQLDLTHATVLRHYNTFSEVYDIHKLAHDQIITEHNLNLKKIYKTENKLIDEIINRVESLNNIQLRNLIDFRIKPFVSYQNKLLDYKNNS